MLLLFENPWDQLEKFLNFIHFLDPVWPINGNQVT